MKLAQAIKKRLHINRAPGSYRNPSDSLGYHIDRY